MADLIFIRHGLTDYNADRRFQGHSDVPLNAEGRRQAMLVAARLRNSAAAALYSSDLARALETARIIGAALNLEPVALAGLREIDVGAAVGLTRAELEARYPELFGEAWVHTAFPGGESYAAVADRLAATVRELAARHAAERILIVTHGGAIRGAVSRLVEIPLGRLVGVGIANTALTEVALAADGRARLRVLNDAAHLEPWAAALAQL
jgi:broad specificity phosphatase PhoE